MSEKTQRDIARINRAFDNIAAHAKAKVERAYGLTISALADHVENIEKNLIVEKKRNEIQDKAQERAKANAKK